MNNLQLFGKRIKELRKAKHLTQERLAEIVGLDVKQISNIEIGACFTTMTTLEKLSSCLEVEINELFRFSHLKPKEELMPDIINQLNNVSHEELELISKFISCITK